MRRVRRRNGQRRAALLAALSDAFGDDIEVVGADAGLHVVAWLKQVPSPREDELIDRAYAAGLGIYAVSRLFAHGTAEAELPPTVGLVMGYASLDEAAIARGVRALRQVVDALFA